MNNFSIAKIKEQVNQQNIHIWLNHLFVIYMFFLPISRKARVSTFVIILVLFFIRGDVLNHIKKALKNKVILAFALYGLIHFLWLNSESFNHTGYTINIVKTSLFYFYPIIFISFIQYKYVPLYLTAFFFGMLFSEFYSYGLFFHLIPETMSYYGTYNDPTPFFHHTHYGLLLAITLSIILYNLFSNAITKVERVFLLLFFISATTNLFITGGRIGHLLFVILMFLIIFRVFRKKTLKYLPVLLLFLTTVFYTAYSTSTLFKSRVDQTVNSASLILSGEQKKQYHTSFGNRLALWEVGTDIVKENPLLGVGTANHMEELKKHAITTNQNPKIVKVLAHTHNEYMRVLLQFGIFGLILYFNIFYQMVTCKQSDYYQKSLLILISTAIFFFGFINTVSEKEELSLTLFITLPLLFLLKKETPETQIHSSSLTKSTVALYILMIIIIYGISRL